MLKYSDSNVCLVPLIFKFKLWSHRFSVLNFVSLIVLQEASTGSPGKSGTFSVCIFICMSPYSLLLLLFYTYIVTNVMCVWNIWFLQDKGDLSPPLSSLRSCAAHWLSAGGCWCEARAGARFPPWLWWARSVSCQAVLHDPVLVCEPSQWATGHLQDICLHWWDKITGHEIIWMSCYCIFHGFP